MTGLSQVLRAAWPEVDFDVEAVRHSGGDDFIGRLVEAGYSGLSIPKEFGGGGMDLQSCCSVQRSIGAMAPDVALGLNMHLFSAGLLTQHWRAESDSSWLLLEAIATQRRLVASAFAEPGLGGRIVRSSCRIDLSGADGLLNGVKRPCSLARRADLFCFQATDASSGEVVVGLVPSTSPGIRVVDDWDWIGMGGSETGSVFFEDVCVPRDLIFHRSAPGDDRSAAFALGVAWFCCTVGAVYLGVGEAALSIATDASRSTTREYNSQADGALGEVAGQLLVQNCALSQVCELVEENDVGLDALQALAVASKAACVDIANLSVEVACRVAGAASLSSGQPLESLVRHVQAGRYHAPTSLVGPFAVGRWARTGSFRHDWSLS